MYLGKYETPDGVVAVEFKNGILKFHTPYRVFETTLQAMCIKACSDEKAEWLRTPNV